jgi:hypothetical protein
MDDDFDRILDESGIFSAQSLEDYAKKKLSQFDINATVKIADGLYVLYLDRVIDCQSPRFEDIAARVDMVYLYYSL